jgi:predicted signal transduction protein with EAL and GGDEF domain
LVTYPEEGSDVESLLRCADEAMYAAKEEGKNRSRVYRRKTVDDGGAGEQVPRQVPVPTGRFSA